MREVVLKMEIYTTLKTQYELAQIEDIDSKKTVTILDPPEIPFERSSPSRKVHLIVGLLVGFISSLFFIFFKFFKDILSHSNYPFYRS